MEKPINNKIIAISGEPVSGKGTAVKAIISKLEKQGYEKENIHLISTGEEFRKFFNSIVDFIKKLNQPEELKKIGKSPQLQQILKNKEYRKVLKETIIKMQNSNIDLTNFSISNANSKSELSEIRRIVDTIIDGNIQQLGKK